MYLAENIEYLRMKNGYSQEYISNLLGYKSFTTIQKWESGVSEPPVKVLKQLSKLFGESMDDLVNIRLSKPETNIGSQTSFSISDKEKKIIVAYRKADEIDKAMVLRTLRLDEEANNTEKNNKLA